MAEPRLPRNVAREGKKLPVKARPSAFVPAPEAAAEVVPPFAAPDATPEVVDVVADAAASSAVALPIAAEAATVEAMVDEIVVAVPPVEAVAAAPVPEPAPEPVTPAASTAPIMQGPKIMASNYDTKTATDRFQGAMGDATERTKTMLEKSTKLAEDMGDFTKGNVEALLASSRVAAKAIETMAQEAAEFSKKSLEHATATTKSFSAVKSPTELLQLQSDYAKASFDSAVAEASKFSEAYIKLLGEIAQPLSNRYAVAAEKLKTGVTL